MDRGPSGPSVHMHTSVARESIKPPQNPTPQLVSRQQREERAQTGAPRPDRLSAEILTQQEANTLDERIRPSKQNFDHLKDAPPTRLPDAALDSIQRVEAATTELDKKEQDSGIGENNRIRRMRDEVIRSEFTRNSPLIRPPANDERDTAFS